MRRREFLLLAGGVTLAWPRAGTGQSPKIHRIGVLNKGMPINDTGAFGSAMVRGFAQLGYVQGKNIAFERRGAAGQVDEFPRYVNELVASKVEIIIALGHPAVLAVTQHSTIPVVAINVGDPVAAGLVKSLARPGGQITGISDVSAELTPKRMEFLRELVPGLRRVAVLWNADDVGMTLRFRASESGAQAIGIAIQALGVRNAGDFDRAFETMSADRPDALLVVIDSLTMGNRKRIFDYAAAHRLPAIYEADFIVRDGGLMSYGPDLDESLARVASLVDRILKGASPAVLPFEQPTRFRLAVNLKTARALGIEFTQSLLLRADEVIE